MSNIIEMPKVGISGKVLQWEVINADGSIDQSCYRPSDNMVLNSGIPVYCYSNWGSESQWFWATFCIGTGTAEPLATDTRLTSQSYAGSCVFTEYNSTTYSTAGSDPYYIYFQRGVLTPLGALNGTYGEIGFCVANGSNLFSKHRLKDELGNPTTITVSSAQQLRLKYVVIFNPSPSTSTTGTINISGIGDIGYEAKWQLMTFPTFRQIYDMYDANTRMVTNSSGILSLGNIGTQPGNPSYSYNTSYTKTFVTPTPGVGEIYHNAYWDVNTANVTWYGIVVPAHGSKVYIINFQTPFTKVNTHTMRFTIKYTIGRS